MKSCCCNILSSQKMCRSVQTTEETHEHVWTEDEAVLTHTSPNRKSVQAVPVFLRVCLCAVVWLVELCPPLLLLVLVLLCGAWSGGAVK